MLHKVCTQQVLVKPLSVTAANQALRERRIIPVNTSEFRYLRFRAIGNMEWKTAGPNGNWDGFPYEYFEDERPGYGYQSFINKRAHVEHNCIPPGVLIQMADGSYKPIEEIWEGDRVVTHKGVSYVTTIFQNYHNAGLVKIDALGIHSALPVTRQHPVWVIPKKYVEQAHQARRYHRREVLSSGEPWQYDIGLQVVLENLPEPVFTYAEDVQPGDLVIIPNGIIGVLPTDERIEDLGFARLLGYYLAEGSTSGNKNTKGARLHQCIQFSTHVDETDILEEIQDLSQRLNIGNVVPRIATNSNAEGVHNCRIINVFSSTFANLCVKHCGRLARGKQLSPDVMAMPANWKKEFLDAYFTGDGWFGEDGGIKSSTASEILSLQLQQMIHSLGATVTIRKLTQHTPNDGWVKNSFGNPIYVLNLSSTQASKLFDTSVDSHPMQQLLPTIYGTATRVTSVEFVEYAGDVFNFEVADHNSYVAGGLIVHNSAKGLAGSIGDLPDAYLNRFSYGNTGVKRWVDLGSKEHAAKRMALLSLPNQKDGSIEVLMRIDTKLVKSAEIESKTKHLLERIIRMIDTGQALTCSMGANIEYSVCSTCGNLAHFSNEYCEHLKPTRKGGMTIVPANQIRDLLDKEALREEWLWHTVVARGDIDDIIKGISNRGIAVRNAELNHVVSFFELSVVATPAYPDAKMLEKLARRQIETREEYLERIYKELGEDGVLDLYGFLQQKGLISTSCVVS